jgi:hypothetical protein
LKTKYSAALDLCADMCSHLPQRRPNCEEILKKKYLWALKEEEFEIDDEMKRELIPKLVNENQIVFSTLKLKLNI